MGRDGGDGGEFCTRFGGSVVKLPPQDWAKTKGGRAILAALGADDGVSRLVGGVVRDALLGHQVMDVDIATMLTPDMVIKRLKKAGVQAVPTGIAHGTVTAVTDDIHIEITTLRRDVSTDGRRATVDYTDDWREDAARRDFTINALYADMKSGEVFDYFGGLDDLKARHVRFIGDPLERIAEDHLRILRFFRFFARFGSDEPDVGALSACAARARDLMSLSRERIRDELLKILGLPDPVPTVRIMLEHGIFAAILPEVDGAGVDALATLVASEVRLGAAPASLRRLTALFPDDAKLLGSLGARLRLSRREAKHVVALADRSGKDVPVAEDAYWRGKAAMTDRLLLGGGTAEDYARLLAWEKPKLPISGRDLIARGTPAGPEVSKRLGKFEKAWVAAGCPMDADALETLIAQS